MDALGLFGAQVNAERIRRCAGPEESVSSKGGCCCQRERIRWAHIGDWNGETSVGHPKCNAL